MEVLLDSLIAVPVSPRLTNTDPNEKKLRAAFAMSHFTQLPVGDDVYITLLPWCAVCLSYDANLISKKSNDKNWIQYLCNVIIDR